ncbi:MAG: hypothetical protein LQ340_000396 [Diploschistes diacapsis]|nr:MAG: hypothetical protein LQ340_000396 [Diploschistes diacapsis]
MNFPNEKAELLPPLSTSKPSAFGPYLELIRFGKPAGTLYLYLPALAATLLAASLTKPIAAPIDVLKTALLFFVGSIIFRGAACTWNDVLDQDIDRRVTRTKNRPLARRAISTRAALLYNVFQSLLGIGIFHLFPLRCVYYGIPSILLIALYPLGKRCTDYPQVILGFTWAYGFVMGFVAMGLDPITDRQVLPVVAFLYGSGIAWTILYDTVYAHQDIRDDKKEGVRSIAIRFEAIAKPFLSCLCLLQVALLIAAGSFIDAGLSYYLGCVCVAISGATMVVTVDLKNPADCAWWFHRGSWLFTGLSIVLGSLVQYVSRLNAGR